MLKKMKLFKSEMCKSICSAVSNEYDAQRKHGAYWIDLLIIDLLTVMLHTR